MAETTGIEWADATWSPWEGCTKVGPGCDHCYAEAMNHWLRKGVNWGAGAPRRTYSDSHWHKPVLWNAKARDSDTWPKVFPSVCDPFDNEAPAGVRERFWELIHQTPNLTWLLLTKRIGNAASMLPWQGSAPWHNVWLGATVVNQEEADRDIPKLLETPAHTRFLSIEPMLGPVDLTGEHLADKCGGVYPFPMLPRELRTTRLEMLDWVIAGGESGRGARPSHPDWFRSLRDQCAAADVPFLFKQWGEWAPGECGAQSPTHTERTAAWCFDRWHFSSLTPRESEEVHRDDEPELYRLGKKVAGRLLDGVQHNGFPG